MAQVFSAPLTLIADYARAGAAGVAQRRNAEIALQQANQQQQQQHHADQLLAQLADRQLNRQYQRAGDLQRIQAQQSLAQQRSEAAAQQDLIDHQQAQELQVGRQQHAWDLNQADMIHEDVAALQKELSSSNLTPEGKVLAGKRLGVLRVLQAEQDKGMWKNPQAYAAALGKWKADTQRLGLENYQVKVPTAAEQWEQSKVEVAPGKFKWPVRNESGAIVRWEDVDTGQKTAEDEAKKRKEFGEQHRRDSAEAERRLKARFEADPANDGVKKAFTDDEIQAEVNRMKAVEEARYRAQQSGTTPPTIAPSPAPAAPPAFTPNVSPATDTMSVTPPPAKSVITKPQVWEDQNVNVPLDHPSIAHADKMGVPHFAHEAGQNGESGPARGFMWKDWLAIGGKPDGTFEPKQPEPQPATQPVPAPADQTPSTATATQATSTAKPASIESAIEDTDEVKLPYGDSQIVTRRALKLADGKKLATTTVDIRGRKLRSVHTGGAWRVLHVDDAGQIKPIGTLPGPDAGAKHSPIEFHSNDAAAISAAVPKGTWLRDESGTLYENE